MTSPFYLSIVVVPTPDVVNTTAVATAAGGATPAVNPSGNVMSGDSETVGSFQVQVWLTAGSNAEAADIQLSFDPSTATYVSTTGPSGWEALANQATPGTVLFSGFDPTFAAPIGTTSDSLVATLNFTSSSASAQSFAATLVSGDYTDLDGNQITPALPAGSVFPLTGFTVTAVDAGAGAGETAGTVGSPLAGAHGTLTLNADGTYTYAINESDPVVAALGAGQSTTDTFTYTVTDVARQTQTATLTVTIDGSATALCFLSGTMITTPSGPIEVEKLAVGQMVRTASGRSRPIVWIGKGNVLATRGRRTAATPVIVRKGAIADNVPFQDLRITKAHALLLNEMLIPVEFLVNHRTIIWDDQAQGVVVYHIELETHDVLLANGVPAESYRDDGNRWLFQNANSGWHLPPQLPCAPVVTGGAVVDKVWKRLLDRSGKRPGRPLTEDPDLHLVVDGERVDAAERHSTSVIFRLERRPAKLRIVSRSAAPIELGVARDQRVLGVGIRVITVREGTRFVSIRADDAALTDGFHEYEPANRLRWTSGDAGIPPALFGGFHGSVDVVLQIGATATYPDDGVPLGGRTAA